MALGKTQNTTLTGIVIPVGWNDNHEVIAAALATDDEKEYRIGSNRKGRELLTHLQRQVDATGSLGEDEKGGWLIMVKRYTVK
jgi:hypothetical protein